MTATLTGDLSLASRMASSSESACGRSALQRPLGWLSNVRTKRRVRFCTETRIARGGPSASGGLRVCSSWVMDLGRRKASDDPDGSAHHIRLMLPLQRCSRDAEAIGCAGRQEEGSSPCLCVLHARCLISFAPANQSDLRRSCHDIFHENQRKTRICFSILSGSGPSGARAWGGPAGTQRTVWAAGGFP